MKLLNTAGVFLVGVMITGMVFAADSKASKSTSSVGNAKTADSKSSDTTKVIPFSGVIQVSDVTTHIDQTGTVEGKVVKVGKSPRSNTYFLDFSTKQKVFTVVIFSKVADEFDKAKVDIKSFEGKKVQVKGKIVSPAQYGPEILLDKKDNIKIVK